MALPFAGIRPVCLCRQRDSYPLGLGLVVEDKPSEFSCIMLFPCITVTILQCVYIPHCCWDCLLLVFD